MQTIEKIFDTYPGGKSGTGVPQSLINQIPPHQVYIEGFLGNGTVLRLKKLAKVNIGIELNQTVAGKWMDAKIPGIWIVPQSFFNFIQSDRFLNEWNNRDTYLFLDPPYIISSRLPQAELYENELTDTDHDRLLNIILDLKCNIGITHYADPKYFEKLKDWRQYHFSSQTRGGRVQEIMFCNYPEPVALHDFKYLGNNYRQREAISKKTKGWLRKLDNMPPQVRLAITSAINDRVHGKGDK